MPAVQHVVRRQRAPKSAIVDQARADFASGRVRLVEPTKPAWPDPGGVEWAFQDARKQRV